MADFRMITAAQENHGTARRPKPVLRILCLSAHSTLADAAGALEVAIIGNTHLVALGAVLDVTTRRVWSLLAAEEGWPGLPFERVHNAAERAAYEAACASTLTVEA